ncbi:BZIP domain-containing protein [Mycena indigotica]|uniref:BZIP domain-containing protein n=1 Tax=Mycena indigotica TaxID=2126181 RepID=A0A8H6SYK8_9AGAR|nr:BZIP domain-containing protein [Mycena indigotica]KAF7307016.1 BZIP domain-containing protein [Mycena indigotica]
MSATPTLWATASKEWVIQPKPKPGRKPKKEATPTQSDEQGRRVQNRAAQRAFRERKQSQLADLQARVQSYEQGEIERNVALQGVAKRLKEENESLRQENAVLKERIAKLEQEHDATLNDKKRWRDISPASSIASSSRKKFKLDHDTTESRFGAPYLASPQSMVSSPDSSTDSRYPSTPFDTQPDTFVTFSQLKSEPGGFPTFDCGYCTPDTPCVCRDVFQQTQDPKMTVIPPTIRSIVLGASSPTDEPSILDNLPPFQPAVPLRLRPRGPTTQINTIFEVSPPQPTCSGDPSNCSACADDSFGKAFCEKLSALPSSETDGVSGNPHSVLAVPVPSLPGLASPPFPESNETIPTSDAWRRFKAHPNVDFSDLDMLADVVARRSKCSGSTVSLSPPPPDHVDPSSESSVLLTDPHAHFREQELARSTPHAHNVREVRADAVREALRLLDSKFLSQ